MPAAVYFKPAAFGDGAKIFWPEGWIEADAKKLDAAHSGFSREGHLWDKILQRCRRK